MFTSPVSVCWKSIVPADAVSVGGGLTSSHFRRKDVPARAASVYSSTRGVG